VGSFPAFGMGQYPVATLKKRPIRILYTGQHDSGGDIIANNKSFKEIGVKSAAVPENVVVDVVVGVAVGVVSTRKTVIQHISQPQSP